MSINEYNCDCNVIHESVVKDIRKGMLSDKVINEVASFFKIVGDPTRTKILSILDKNELCVCDIANLLNMTKSSISHQLKTLKEAGIVKCNRVGKEVYYTLDDEHVSEVFEVALYHIGHRRRKNNEKI